MDAYEVGLYKDTAKSLGFNATAAVDIRKNLGYARGFAQKIGLTATLPRGDLSSTGYCLGNVTAGRYLVYLPSGGAATVDLTASPGKLSVEWFSPARGVAKKGHSIDGGAPRSSRHPFLVMPYCIFSPADISRSFSAYLLLRGITGSRAVYKKASIVAQNSSMRSERHPRLGLISPYTGGNLGDAAIIESARKQLLGRFGDAEIILLVLDPASVREIHRSNVFNLSALPREFYFTPREALTGNSGAGPSPSPDDAKSLRHRVRTGLKGICRCIPFALPVARSIRGGFQGLDCRSPAHSRCATSGTKS